MNYDELPTISFTHLNFFAIDNAYEKLIYLASEFNENEQILTNFIVTNIINTHEFLPRRYDEIAMIQIDDKVKNKYITFTITFTDNDTIPINIERLNTHTYIISCDYIPHGNALGIINIKL